MVASHPARLDPRASDFDSHLAFFDAHPAVDPSLPAVAFPAGSETAKAFDAVAAAAAAAATIEAHAAVVAETQADSKRVKTLARAEIADRLASIARTTPEASDGTTDVQRTPMRKRSTGPAQ